MSKQLSIESPLSAFNNLLLQITEKIKNIYISNKTKTNNIEFINDLLFEENSITIRNQVKFSYCNQNVGIQFIGLFQDLSIIQKTIDNEKTLLEIFQNYLYLIKSASTNFDDNVSQKQIDSIYSQLKTGTIDSEQMFLLPYKRKINHLYDSSKNDKTLENIFHRFAYVIKFNLENKTHFKYKICRVLSTILNESKSMENIRFEDIEILKENIVPLNKSCEFLKELYYYGEIK